MHVFYLLGARKNSPLASLIKWKMRFIKEHKRWKTRNRYVYPLTALNFLVEQDETGFVAAPVNFFSRVWETQHDDDRCSREAKEHVCGVARHTVFQKFTEQKKRERKHYLCSLLQDRKTDKQSHKKNNTNTTRARFFLSIA